MVKVRDVVCRLESGGFCRCGGGDKATNGAEG